MDCEGQSINSANNALEFGFIEPNPKTLEKFRVFSHSSSKKAPKYKTIPTDSLSK